jgi:DNA-binding CsgD family transcriptional regulator
MAVSVRHLVGREDELAALLDLLDAPDELPAAAVVVGEAGIGKTTLSLAVAEAAEARGYLVLSCRLAEAEAAFSFVGLTDLIGGVVHDVLPQLPRPQRRALEAALALSEFEGPPAEEGVVAFAFLSTLQQLAVDNRLLLAIDDVQWLDAPSLAMLRFALPRLESERAAAILTARDEVPPWLPRALPEARLLTIELGPLSVGALHELLRTRVGGVLPRPTLLRIWETSAGNPFFALELANALQRRGGRVGPGEELPIPSNLEELLHERVDRLGAPGLHVARLVAALADPTVDLVEAASGTSAETGRGDALEARILEVDGERLRFTHPLLRSAVWSGATPAERRSLHARLAQVAPSKEERARHLALATVKPSRQIASILEDAALATRDRGAPGTAADLADQALRLTPRRDVADARRRLLFAADRYYVAGEVSRAIALLERARAEAAPGVERATVLVQLGDVMFEAEQLEVEPLYQQALAEAKGDDGLQARIHRSLAELMGWGGGLERGLAHANLAMEAALRTDDVALKCCAIAVNEFFRFRAGRGVPHVAMEEAVALERALSEWPLASGPTEYLCQQLVWSVDLERARVLLLELLDARTSQDDSGGQAWTLWNLGFLEWRAGNWNEADRYATESLDLTTQLGIALSDEFPTTAIAAHKGRIVDARAPAHRSSVEGQTDRNVLEQSGHDWVLGFVELSIGDAKAALVHLRRSYEHRNALMLEPAMRLELGDLVEALIATGELAEAANILAAWEPRARALDRAWALAILGRCRALLLAARGDLTGAEAGFERALAEHARTQDPFQHARTLLAQGVTQRRSKQRGAARLTLEQALAIFERLGAPLWAEKARAEVGRIGGRAPSRGELTEAESRVAALVAEGRTNREVAAALFVTEHTVEGALTRAYRKLGIRSRAELAARLARET